MRTTSTKGFLAATVSLNTVKTHCAAIFRKLEVSDRKSAVQAARDRRLL